MRFLIFFVVFMLLQLDANAFNALAENRRYKEELDVQASRQYVENYRHTKYYKGRPDFLYYTSSRYKTTSASRGSTSLSKKKDLYVKKGVKFKLSDEDKIKIIKDKQQQELEKEQKIQEANQKKVDVSTKKAESVEKQSTKKTHSLTAIKKASESEASVNVTVKQEEKKTEEIKEKNLHNADAE